jgi:hypothetical protein
VELDVRVEEGEVSHAWAGGTNDSLWSRRPCRARSRCASIRAAGRASGGGVVPSAIRLRNAVTPTSREAATSRSAAS